MNILFGGRLCLLLGLVTGAFGQFGSAQPISGDNPLHLAASVTVLNGAAPSLMIELRNGSARSACISKQMIEPGNSSITLRDAAGKLVNTSSRYSPGYKDYYGVNYAEPYFFLFPNRELVLTFSLKGFSLSSGSYSYEWSVPYHICEDIFGKGSKAVSQGVPLHLLKVKGVFHRP